jgi:hypothetical protein
MIYLSTPQFFMVNISRVYADCLLSITFIVRIFAIWWTIFKVVIFFSGLATLLGSNPSNGQLFSSYLQICHHHFHLSLIIDKSHKSGFIFASILVIISYKPIADPSIFLSFLIQDPGYLLSHIPWPAYWPWHKFAKHHQKCFRQQTVFVRF